MHKPIGTKIYMVRLYGKYSVHKKFHLNRLSRKKVIAKIRLMIFVHFGFNQGLIFFSDFRLLGHNQKRRRRGSTLLQYWAWKRQTWSNKRKTLPTSTDANRARKFTARNDLELFHNCPDNMFGMFTFFDYFW